MLGKTARWLRFLGYDTVYNPEAPKRKLIKLCQQENRIFLTRDRRLKIKQDLVRVLLIESERWEVQLKQIILNLHIDTVSYRFSICSICNQPVCSISNEEAAFLVPNQILNEIHTFWKCHHCGRVYWQGGHWNRMNEKLDTMKFFPNSKEDRNNDIV
jgi:uncharacterized protein with PIN domain